MFEELFGGELGVRDLWNEHGEHRPLIPRIFLLLVGLVASFDVMTVMYATQLCLLATFVGLFLAYKDTVGFSTGALFFAIPLALLVFSLNQHWNMFRAWSIHVVVVNSFGVLAFLLLSKLPGRKLPITLLTFLLAVSFGSAATLSAGHGLLIWPAGLISLLLTPLSRKTTTYLSVAWALVGAAHWIFYFRNFQTPENRSSEVYFFHSPTLGVEYFLGLVGSALFLDSGFAIVTGAVIGTLFVAVVFWIAKRREQQKYVFWITLSAFSILILASTTYGRSGEGLGASLPSKYVTFSVLLFIGVYVMALGLARDRIHSRLTTLLVGVCLGLVVLSTPLSYYSSVQRAERIEREGKEKACVLLNYEDVSNLTLQQTFYPLKSPEKGKELRSSAALFEERNYTTFALSAMEVQSELGCKPRPKP